MGRNVLFIHFSGEIKDLSLERIRGFAHCRTSLFPRPSALHYELENDATAEKSMHTVKNGVLRYTPGALHHTGY